MSIAIVGFWIFECLSFSIILIEADDFAVEGLLMVPFFFFSVCERFMIESCMQLSTRFFIKWDKNAKVLLQL